MQGNRLLFRYSQAAVQQLCLVVAAMEAITYCKVFLIIQGLAVDQVLQTFQVPVLVLAVLRVNALTGTQTSLGLLQATGTAQ